MGNTPKSVNQDSVASSPDKVAVFQAPPKCGRVPRASLFPLNTEETPLSQLKKGVKPNYPKVGYYGWKFQRYLPSPFEAEWFQELKDREAKEDVEHVIMTTAQKMKARFDKLMTFLDLYATKLVFPERNVLLDQCNDVKTDVCGRLPEDLDADVLSRFEYKYDCWDGPCDGQVATETLGKLHYGFVEPLVGHLRHPGFTIKKDDAFLGHRSFIIVDKWSAHNVGRPSAPCDGTRSVVLDAGASTFLPVDWSSQSYLDSIASCMCTPMTDYYGWEANTMKPDDFFNQIPGSMTPKYRFYNVPCSAADESWRNPLNIVLKELHEQDLVIFKLDIDAPIVEGPLAQKIIDTPEVAHLVDEFIFEHHVKMGRMQNWWGGSNIVPSISIKLFQDMRHLGIRAHSWI